MRRECEKCGSTDYNRSRGTGTGVICYDCVRADFPDKCHECGKGIDYSYSEPYPERLKEGQICFGCLFWVEWVEKKDDPETVRVKGSHYHIGDESKGGGRWSGFAGSRFHIRFHDGREVVSTNLWHQGTIPASFRDRLPDNAEFYTPKKG